MSRQVIIRALTGILLAFIGYSSSDRFLPHTGFLKLPYIYQALSAFVFGLIGVFLIPVISKAVGGVFSRLTEKMAREVARQSKALMDLREKRRKSSKPQKIKNAEFFSPMVVDTSSLIDGRIADVVRTGFISGTFLIPKSVILELRHVADSGDALRRQRGRRGLDVMEGLKKASRDLRVTIVEDGTIKGRDVDEKLVEIAKKYKARILTVDFNLNKAAKVSGVGTLNINDLANSVKTVVLPGEQMSIKIIQEGKEEGQGVGYLPDGTMVVVENGKSYVGQEVLMEVSRVIQTAAGKIIFGKRKEEEVGSQQLPPGDSGQPS